MGILRLLTNKTVMGSDRLKPEDAWNVWHQVESDERTFKDYSTPGDLEPLWYGNIMGRVPSPKIWTDAWLAAFAECRGLEMVTFDKGFRQFRLSSLNLLEG